MRKVIVIIKKNIAHSASTRAVFSIITFFLLATFAKSQSKVDSLFNKINLPERTVLMNQKELNVIL